MNNKPSTKQNRRNSANNEMSIILFGSAVVGLAILIVLILSLIFSPSANKTADAFIEFCRIGDTVGIEQFAFSAYSEVPAGMQAILDEFDAVSSDSDASSDGLTPVETSSSDVKPSIQSVVMTFSEYEASTIWTLNKSANLKIKVTAPDMDTIIGLIYEELHSESAKSITEERLYNKIIEYCNQGVYVTEDTIKIPMERKGGTWFIDFEDTEILDTLTGGLITAYNNLYMQAYEDFVASYSEMEVIGNEE